MERFVLWHRVVPTPRDEPDDAGPLAEWTTTAIDRILRAGGEVTSSVGASIAADFDPADAEPAMELALKLLADAATWPMPSGGCWRPNGARPTTSSRRPATTPPRTPSWS